MAMAHYTSTATTPEQLRQELIKFLLVNETEKRAQARVAVTQRARREYTAKAETYEFIKQFLQQLEIKSNG